MRFSPRFLNVFLRLPAGSFFSGVAPSAASVFAIIQSRNPYWVDAVADLDRLLLGNRALARALAGARVGARPLAVHGQAAAVAHAAIAADFHQPLDVHRDLLAEIAFDAALLLDDAADLPHVVLGEVLHADIAADPGFLENQVRAHAPDAEDVGETDFNA